MYLSLLNLKKKTINKQINKIYTVLSRNKVPCKKKLNNMLKILLSSRNQVPGEKNLHGTRL